MSVVAVGRVQKDGRELTKRQGDCEISTINISLYLVIVSYIYGRGQEPAGRIVRVSDYSRPSFPPRAQTAPTAASSISTDVRSQGKKGMHQWQITKDQLHKMQPHGK